MKLMMNFETQKKGSSEKTLNNGRFLAFYEILEWIEERERRTQRKISY